MLPLPPSAEDSVPLSERRGRKVHMVVAAATAPLRGDDAILLRGECQEFCRKTALAAHYPLRINEDEFVGYTAGWLICEVDGRVTFQSLHAH